MTTRKKTASHTTTARGATAMHGHTGAKPGPGQSKKSPAKSGAAKTSSKSSTDKRDADDEREESPRVSASERSSNALEGLAHNTRAVDAENDERMRGTLKSNLDRDPASRHREAVTGTEAEEDGVDDESLDDVAESDVERDADEDADTDETEEKVDEKRRH